MHPSSLPIYAHAEAIVAAVRKHQVVVVEGAAGTGKTTQLPHILRAAGFGQRCIGITQPRRIAAVSVAWRIASEAQVPIGDSVGYAIRFDDATSARTRIKAMTDGILLQEARADPLLQAYDTIIVDEAHERSLNIDFTLGLLFRILPQRPDLRVIISSATLYPGTFQKFFSPVAKDVPVIRVEARTFPLTIRHVAVRGASPEKLLTALGESVLELHQTGAPGHILVFLPGEGLILKLEQLLRQAGAEPSAVILPLYGRLTRSEQERIFEDFGARRKIILGTNLAETSITIDQVNYVVDAGLAKLPWFNVRTGVTTLREIPISQASATQRAGRAGRTGPGQVVRLYSEASLRERPEFTPEEIARVDLSEAVLRLIDLGIRDVEGFPFPTPPPSGKLRAALTTLTALGAIDRDRQLTAVGRMMVPFPLSPALARMVVEAALRFPDAAHDVLTVGAYLSVRSPFLYPMGEEAAAKRAQRSLRRPEGDIVTGVHTVHAWRQAEDREAFCKKHYLDADTMAFIERAHTQLCDIASAGGVQVQAVEAPPETLIRCVAAGFADKVMRRRGPVFETASRVTAALHPGSVLFGAQHRLLVAAELFDAGRTYAVNVSPLKPEWLPEINPDAAARWNMGGARGARPNASARLPAEVAAAAVPSHLKLGPLQLEVSSRARRPVVILHLSDLRALSAHLKTADALAALPPAAHRWRAQVVGPEGTWLRGPLLETLALVPVVPWPQGSVGLPRGLPLGDLLQVERHVHLLNRHLPLLLQPAAGRGVEQPGWISLVTNGQESFWFDVVGQFKEAVLATDVSLTALAQSAMAPALEAALAAASAHCTAQLRALRLATRDSGVPGRGRGRGRSTRTGGVGRSSLWA